MDAPTQSFEIVQSLHLVGDPGASMCDGDFCEVPEHLSQSVVNRRVDEDSV